VEVKAKDKAIFQMMGKAIPTIETKPAPKKATKTAPKKPTPKPINKVEKPSGPITIHQKETKKPYNQLYQ